MIIHFGNIEFRKFYLDFLLLLRSQTLVNCTSLDSVMCIVYFYNRLKVICATSKHLERDKCWKVGCSYGYLNRPVLQPSLGPVKDHSGIAPGLSHRLIFTLSDNRLDAIWNQIKTTHMFTPTCESQKYQKLGHFWVSIQGECSKKPANFHCLGFVMIYSTNMTCYVFSP